MFFNDGNYYGTNTLDAYKHSISSLPTITMDELNSEHFSLSLQSTVHIQIRIRNKYMRKMKWTQNKLRWLVLLNVNYLLMSRAISTLIFSHIRSALVLFWAKRMKPWTLSGDLYKNRKCMCGFLQRLHLAYTIVYY